MVEELDLDAMLAKLDSLGRQSHVLLTNMFPLCVCVDITSCLTSILRVPSVHSSLLPSPLQRVSPEHDEAELQKERNGSSVEKVHRSSTLGRLNHISMSQHVSSHVNILCSVGSAEQLI